MATKYTKRQTGEEVEFLKYKVEIMERRIEKLENLLMNGKGHHNDGSSMNQEVMQFLLSMLKQQTISPQSNTSSAPSCEAQQQKHSDGECINGLQEKNEALDSFKFNLKGRTFGI